MDYFVEKHSASISEIVQILQNRIKLKQTYKTRFAELFCTIHDFDVCFNVSVQIFIMLKPQNIANNDTFLYLPTRLCFDLLWCFDSKRCITYYRVWSYCQAIYFLIVYSLRSDLNFTFARHPLPK